MRALADPRTGVQLLDTVDVVGQWRMNETLSTSQVVDDSGRSNSLTVTNTPGVGPALYDQAGTTVGSREFRSASSEYASRSGTGHTTELYDEATWAFWFRPRSVSFAQPICSYGGDGSVLPQDNILFEVERSGTELVVRWQWGVSNNVSGATSGLGLAADETYFVCVSRVAKGSTFDVDVFVWHLGSAYDEGDGLIYSTARGDPAPVTGGTGPDGGTANPRFRVAIDPSDSIYADFDMSDLVLARTALSEEWAREQFFRGVATYSRSHLQDNLINSSEVRARARVLDTDSNAWVDLNDYLGKGWVVSGSMSQHIDDPYGNCQLQLVRSQNLRASAEVDPDAQLSISPAFDDVESAPGGIPLIGPKSEVKIDIAQMPGRRAYSVDKPREWEYSLHWHGFAGRIDAARNLMNVPVEQLGIMLRDMWLTEADTYGDDGSPEPVEDVMQEQIDDAIASAVSDYASATYLGGHTPQLRVVSSPGLDIGEYLQEQEPVMNSLRALARETGFDFRFRFVDSLQAFVPDLLDIDRSKSTVDYTFGYDQIADWNRLEYGSDDIRNAIHVTCIDSDGDRLEVTAVDSSSIDRYGYLWAEINEGEAHRIRTLGQITALAGDVLSDLSEPIVWAEITLGGFFPGVELYDRYTFQHDGIVQGGFTACVIGYRHDFADDGTIVTTIEVRGDTPALSREEWEVTLAGQGGAPSAPLYTMPAISGFFATGGAAEARFEWDQPSRAALRNYDVYEVWTGGSGFTTSTGTLRARVRTNSFTWAALDPSSVDGYVAVRARDIWGNASALTTPVAFDVNYTVALPRCKATLTSAFTLSGDTRIRWDAEDYDVGSNFDLTADEWIAPVTGLYRVRVHAVLPTNVASRTLQLWLEDDVGGLWEPKASFGFVANAPSTADLEHEIELSAGDKVRAYANDSQNRNLTTDSYMSVSLIADGT